MFKLYFYFVKVLFPFFQEGAFLVWFPTPRFKLFHHMVYYIRLVSGVFLHTLFETVLNSLLGICLYNKRDKFPFLLFNRRKDILV